jgi:hypothetical protein
MPPDDANGRRGLNEELGRLAEEVQATRERLHELSIDMTAACDLVATILSSLRGVESTPGDGGAQVEADDSGRARAG